MLRVPFYDSSPSKSLRRELLVTASEVIGGGVYVGGDHLANFEGQLRDYLSPDGFVVGVGNGLDALTLSLRALEVGPGDEVIVPSYSFIATWIAVFRVGATCVVVDVDPHSGLVQIDRVKSKVTSRTKAFIPVHLYGASVDLVGLSAELSEVGVAVIEDCAQSIGAEVNSMKTGTIGTFGAFSFYPTKNLGGLGDGGAIFTHDEQYADKLISLRSYGFNRSRYEFANVGFNSRLDSIQAAFLSRKLLEIDRENSTRRTQAARYSDAAASVGLSVVEQPPRSVFHHFGLRVGNRAAVREALSIRAIETDMHYPYTFEAFAKLVSVNSVMFQDEDLVGAREIAQKVVTLPIGSWMTQKQTDAVASGLQALSAYRD